MRVLITAILTVGTIAIVSLFAPAENGEIVKLAIASIGSLATGVEVGRNLK